MDSAIRLDLSLQKYCKTEHEIFFEDLLHHQCTLLYWQSGINNKIRASAYLLGLDQTFKLYLGPQSYYTVYTGALCCGKLVFIHFQFGLRLQLFWETCWSSDIPHINDLVDSQRFSLVKTMTLHLYQLSSSYPINQHPLTESPVSLSWKKVSTNELI